MLKDAVPKVACKTQTQTFSAWVLPLIYVRVSNLKSLVLSTAPLSPDHLTVLNSNRFFDHCSHLYCLLTVIYLLPYLAGVQSVLFIIAQMDNFKI